MTDARLLQAALTDAARLESSGDRAGAIARLGETLKPVPAHFTGWLRLSRLLYAAGRKADAVRALRTAEQADPLAGAFQRVQHSMQNRDFAAARTAAEAMLADAPGHPRAVFTLAHLANARGDFETAVQVLDAGLAEAPANPVLQTMRVAALEQTGDYAGALEAAETLADLDDSFEALWTFIGAALRYGRNAQALEACERAAPLAAGDKARQSALSLVRGQALRILGRREDAVTALRASLADDPSNADAWWALADMKTHRFTAEDEHAMDALVHRRGLRAERKSPAAFALGRAREMAGDWPAAMNQYHRANALHAGSRFDPGRFAATIDRLIGAFTKSVLATQAPASGPVPIFIVGLPRSGSTLVEQMLASHPAIEGTIEQPSLPAVKRKAHLACVRRHGGDYLDRVGALSEAELSQLGAAYLSASQTFRSTDAGIFTDKLPNNFEHVGLIHKILPQAVIIDIRRNPLDCGLSLYKQHFARGVEFSYNLAHIGAYYNGYLKLMDHWNAVIPGKVITVQYEALVHDPEPVITAMLAHAGLAFDPACLAFHTTRRAVRTASSEQVRTPLNTAGLGVWRMVEEELAPLKSALGPDTLSRFDAYL